MFNGFHSLEPIYFHLRQLFSCSCSMYINIFIVNLHALLLIKTIAYHFFGIHLRYSFLFSLLSLESIFVSPSVQTDSSSPHQITPIIIGNYQWNHSNQTVFKTKNVSDCACVVTLENQYSDDIWASWMSHARRPIESFPNKIFSIYKRLMKLFLFVFNIRKFQNWDINDQDGV